MPHFDNWTVMNSGHGIVACPALTDHKHKDDGDKQKQKQARGSLLMTLHWPQELDIFLSFSL